MGSKRKRVVVIAYFFPPMSTVGCHRPLRLCRHLAERGVSVTVYAGHPRFTPINETVDDSLNALIPEQVEVRRLPSLHPVQWALNLRDRLFPGRKGRRTAPASPPAGGGSEPGRGPSLKAALESFLASFSFPDRYSGWILASLPVLVADLLFRRADAVFVTGPPWSPLVLAHLAGRITGTPVCLDYRDPWNLNPYHAHAGAPKARLVALEKRILDAARGILTNTRSMAECYAGAHPGVAHKILPVYNGIDAATAAEMERIRAGGGRKDDGLFRVSHIGTLYRNRMPPGLARMLAHAAAAWKGERDIRFRFVGWLEDPAPLEEAFAACGCAHKLERPGQVGPSRAREEQVEADVLLLLQSGTAMQIPAKVFEYALTGRPLACFADPGSETGALIERYSLGKVFRGDEEPGAFLSALQDMSGGRPMSPETRPDPSAFAGDFDGEALAGRMADFVLAPRKA